MLKFSLCSAQIPGFSADFHRKLLNIVKQHPNNARINWELENGGKIRVLTFQKVAKTGNIGGKKSPVTDCIDYLLTVLFL